MTVLIPLPCYYNADRDGHRRRIEDEKFTSTAEEVALAFEGGGTLWRWPNSSTMRGFWWSRGFLHQDVLAALEVDVLDTPQNRAWFQNWALALLERFKQDAIYVKFVGQGATITTHVIERRPRI